MPTEPEEPAGNAPHATVLSYERRSKWYLAVIAGLAEIRKQVLVAIGPTMHLELRKMPGGLIAQTLPRILIHIEKRCSFLANENIRKLTTQVQEFTFTSPTTFPTDAAMLRLLFQKLARGSQAKSEFDQIEVLRNATATIPTIQAAILTYEEGCISTNPPTSGVYKHHVSRRASVATSHTHHYALATAQAAATVATAAPTSTSDPGYDVGFAAGLQAISISSSMRTAGAASKAYIYPGTYLCPATMLERLSLEATGTEDFNDNESAPLSVENKDKHELANFQGQLVPVKVGDSKRFKILVSTTGADLQGSDLESDSSSDSEDDNDNTEDFDGSLCTQGFRIQILDIEVNRNLTDQIQDLFDTDFFEKEEEEEEEEVKEGQKLPKRTAEEGQDHSLKAAEVVELELER
ncbi:hypothetical protein B484DRAFT_403465 [Ochromonadaceae sp. CCMP2298]|nr:hypothetical protein B484DRAFT_403465 [Ochromonadaceae sp. CCMP2298]